MEAGTETIKHYVKTLPHGPGVYRMIDIAGKILYVGKARDLKNRVTNYTSLAGKNNRLATMIMQTVSMEFVTTRSEAEALLLEANLIKKLEPRYNILLRDGKTFPFLRMTEHEFPRICKYRGTREDKGDYFGPFASAGDVDKVIKQLQRAFLLRPCSDTMFESRNRPCLQYQIKRCSAPCVDYIGKSDYRALLKQAKDFLRGKSRDVQNDLLAEMTTTSEAQDYEQAAKLRDRLRALSQIQREQGLYFPQVKDADIIGISLEKGMACVQVFFFRDGQNYGNQPHFLRIQDGQTEIEILSAFIPQFYQNRATPKQLLLSHETEQTELLQEALNTRVITPKRGDKADAMKQVIQNAKQSLRRHLDTRMSQTAQLEKIAELFGLDAPPERIEVYDNSHISGTHAVGGMIVAGPDGFIKNQYRKFTIKEAAPDDDFAMMREVLTRRLKRLGEEDTPIPLLLIDGGKGQFSAVRTVMEELGVWGEVPVVAISKGPNRHAGREKFHLQGKPEFQLPINDPTLHYLQRLRDEAHRFAIGAHRSKRSSALKKSELDTIPGIGAKRKKALLQHFGSARAVSNASLEEISAVEGINTKTAQTIWRQFHS
ncbi:MAG: excinuclease ABC subunit UvrC [Rickettsiales bacterium]|nr:excinuclease ABC subunit UvrC [Rickettsiales bacterium]